MSTASVPDPGNLSPRGMGVRWLLLVGGGILFLVLLIGAIIAGVNRWVVPTTDAFKQYAATAVGTSDSAIGTVLRVEPVTLGTVQYRINNFNGSSRRRMQFSAALIGTRGTSTVNLLMVRDDPATTWTVLQSRVAGVNTSP